jgi:uncharacterized protein with ParB-like and HNH nuclease domain
MNSFNILDIFQDTYKIPIYQRAYSWTDLEINTLIDDIYDYYQSGKKQNYYIGSLVIHIDKNKEISVIDGQQRLTTLSLIINYMKNELPGLSLVDNLDVKLIFESRRRSTEILYQLSSKDDFEKVLTENDELVNGYRVIKKKFQEKISPSRKKFDEGYFKYLLENVLLIKNQLPQETDLNHYFEIMNSRGEQLEKHDIVKAHLLSFLSEKDFKE